MNTILTLDLGKFKTVYCWYDVGSGMAKFQTVPSSRHELAQVLARQQESHAAQPLP